VFTWVISSKAGFEKFALLQRIQTFEIQKTCDTPFIFEKMTKL
jgi:hypothetical protein